MAEMAKTPRFTKEEIIRIVKEQNIRFVRLQFTDIFGQCKNVAITESQLERRWQINACLTAPQLRASCGLRNPICICIRI